MFPHRANYVVAIDGFTAPTKKGFKSREWLLRTVGCICKRKFTNDAILVRQLNRVIKNGDIAMVSPLLQVLEGGVLDGTLRMNAKAEGTVTPMPQKGQKD